MRFEPSPMIKNVSGKFGTQITNVMKGSSAGNIQTLKNYTKPFNPNTTAQQETRKAFKYSSDLYFYGQDVSDGGVVIWDEGVLRDNCQEAARNTNYRGIATMGNNSGVQLLNAQSVKFYRSSPTWKNIVDANKLPQAMTPAEITILSDEITLIVAAMNTMKQEDRLGYTN